MRRLTNEERKAYGLPPLAEDEGQQEADAKIAHAAETGNLQGGVDANGNDVVRVTERYDPKLTAGTPRPAYTPPPAGAFGSTNTNLANNRPDWQLFVDPNLEKNRAALANAFAARQGQPVQTMQAAQLDGGPQSNWQAQQRDLARLLSIDAAGGGPSAAQAQLQAGADMASANALGLARNARGNQGIAMKQALSQQGQIGQQAAGQAAALRMQEMQNARAQFAGVIAGARDQDIGFAAQNANLAQDAARQNLAASMQQQQQLDDMTKYYVSTGLSLEQAQNAAKQEYEKLRVLSYNQQRAAQIAEDTAKRQQEAQIASSVFNTAGQVVGVGVDAYQNSQQKNPQTGA